MKLRERDLEIDFTNAVDAVVFDQMKADKPHYHGIGQMHRVDFVVELEEAILFVEVKDPGNPKAQAEGLAKFFGELQDGTLGNTFAAKFIDTFLYGSSAVHSAPPREVAVPVAVVEEGSSLASRLSWANMLPLQACWLWLSIR